LYGILNVEVSFFAIVWSELILFLLSMVAMFKAGDLRALIQPHGRNIALFLPMGAILGPILQLGNMFGYPLPELLVIPSFLNSGIFTYSIVAELQKKWNGHMRRNQL
jgi:hypothetical protein